MTNRSGSREPIKATAKIRGLNYRRREHDEFMTV